MYFFYPAVSLTILRYPAVSCGNKTDHIKVCLFICKNDVLIFTVYIYRTVIFTLLNVHCNMQFPCFSLKLKPASFSWDIVAPDGTLRSAAYRMWRLIWGYSVCSKEFHGKIKEKFKFRPEASKNWNGLTQMIMMDESICHVSGLISIFCS